MLTALQPSVKPLADVVGRYIRCDGQEAVRHKKGERRVKCDFNQADAMQAAADDDVLASSLKLMDRNKHVYEELAK